ncbi:ferredoxin--NADP reductase [Mesohalobacter halotolerans]|jgi:ring-1,2-phenylacetyl-CoA epoxidase subunit PaaE|uniref:Ferredoxin--NADP reductase n=1 Tax=Mesohalobacter halotolerans TaxID=1883405 RepID=A0A4U5TTA2_9FLAO|nr:ferredoxin--NADP reductase [Mesohalobacter halotolerans]NBC58334.1 2Fe-2S iron-sulfur cluster binding domain-containing protein [Bacteroidota bacterium]TKS57363.1 ferredoxin--NADP reductase [Mesohalobacter halotolerans]
MSLFHTLQVKAIERQTDKAVKISFDIPENLTSEFQYQPGQYITLSKTINGDEIRRSYSICSTPGEDLSIVVKAIADGVFSNYANQKLKTGDSLEVMPPEGHFTPTLETTSNFCAFAAGSGITPVMSILKSTLQFNDDAKFVLVYGNKSPQETIFFEELLALKKHYPERLFVENIYSQTREDNAHFGRIEKPTVNYALKNKYSGIDFSEYFLCGPEPMIEHVQEVLRDNGIDESKIKYELFYSEKEAEDIANTDGKTKLKIIVDDEEHELVMDQDKVILDAILEQDIDVPYSCQGGICSSCLAKIKTGKAEMRKNQILTDEEVEQGLVLTCQAQPQTPEVIVDYDDI